jgi:hypothetical protein
LHMRFKTAAVPFNRMEFATDGKKFYFTVSERESDVWMLNLRR